MSYILNGSTIHRPKRMNVSNSTQFAANRTLNGTNTRDYFGSNKRVWTLEYENLNTTDFGVIDGLYQAFLSTRTVVPFQVSEGNYTVSSTNVQVDLLTRDFSVPGSSYISNCTLILTEA
jgi:hypothetical protein